MNRYDNNGDYINRMKMEDRYPPLDRKRDDDYIFLPPQQYWFANLSFVGRELRQMRMQGRNQP